MCQLAEEPSTSASASATPQPTPTPTPNVSTSNNGSSIKSDVYVNDNDNDESQITTSTSTSTTTFLSTLHQTVLANPSKTFATWYNAKGTPTHSYTYSEIWQEAGHIAYILHNSDNNKSNSNNKDPSLSFSLQPNDRVVLCYNFGLSFFAAFLGCLRANITAVLVYPPNPSNLKGSLEKMTLVANDCDAKCILVDGDIEKLRRLDRLNPFSKSRDLWQKDIPFVNIHSMIHSHMKIKIKNGSGNGDAVDYAYTAQPKSSDIAFLQYTSGSTGNPKGVMISYSALQSNVQAILHHARVECEANTNTNTTDIPFGDCSTLSWVPQYHDMGLIGATIAPFCAGWSCHMMSPVTFVQNPLLWMELMGRLRVHFSLGPDFAYHLAARKFNEKKKLTGGKEPIPDLDLSNVILLQSGAEPIRRSTVELFHKTFSPYGLNDNWFSAIYGMAEMVVCISSLRRFQLSEYECTHNNSKNNNNNDKNNKNTPGGGQKSIAVAHMEQLAPGLEIKIVDPVTCQEITNGGDGDGNSDGNSDGDNEPRIGEVWLRSPSIAKGYFHKPTLTKEVFYARLNNSKSNSYPDNNTCTYLRTGDLGFVEYNYLYICGRIKDLIIVNGVNYYPQDIELSVQNVSQAIRPGCIAAFCSHEDGGDLEVVFEIRNGNGHGKDVASVVEQVKKEIVQNIGLIPSRIVAIKERSICKTTSGKIQRKATRKALHEDKCQIVFEYRSSGSHSTIGMEDDSVVVEKPISIATPEDTFDNIVMSFFGKDKSYSANSTWQELGMSSMTSVQLRDAISESFVILLEPDCFQIYSTPAEMKAFVLKGKGVPLAVSLPTLNNVGRRNLSWNMCGLLQLLYIPTLLLLFSGCILPASYAGTYMAKVFKIQVAWYFMPITIPTWMISFSLTIIGLKWIIVGRYREGVVSIPSTAYVRWWCIDRAMELWEFWIGRFVIGTPFMNLFYRLLGSKVEWSANFHGYIREFDLVTVGQNASVNSSLHCRKFGVWKKNDIGPTLRFRPVVLGNGSCVKNIVSPGVSIGHGAIVEKISMAPEGAIVPERTRVAGNPSIVIETFPPSESAAQYDSKRWWKIGMLQLSWLILELHFLFATALSGVFVYNNSSIIQDRISTTFPWNGRYEPILRWFLLILWFSYISIITSVLFKWMLIGKKRPGPIKGNGNVLWRSVADWAVDWHYRNALYVLTLMTFNSRMWNFIFQIFGMDIDMHSKVFADVMRPSSMDLMKVRTSFLATISFDTNYQGSYCLFQVFESSIGRSSYITKGAKIINSIIPPRTYITEDMVGHGHSTRDRDGSTASPSLMNFIIGEIHMFVSFLAILGFQFVSLIPSYELWTQVLKPRTTWEAVPCLVPCLLVQTFSSVLLLALYQLATLVGSKDSGRPWSDGLYSSYQSMNALFHNFTFQSLLSGTPAYNFIMKLLGCKIEGRVLLYPYRLYEHIHIEFTDRTIVDSALINGHYAVLDRITVGPCKISGTVHPGTFAAVALLAGDESGPSRTYVGTCPHPRDDSGASGNGISEDLDSPTASQFRQEPLHTNKSYGLEKKHS